MLKAPMKVRVLTALLFIPLISAHSAENPTPFAIVNINSIDRGANPCNGKWKFVSTHLFWLDEARMVLSGDDYCDSRNREGRRTKQRLITVSNDGHIMGTWSDGWFTATKGPGDTILLSRAHSVDLMDRELQVEQSIQCPTNKRACEAFTPDSPTDSDFAVCYNAAPVQTCSFYRGRPAAETKKTSFQLSSESVIESPYKNIPASSLIDPPSTAWKASQSELWFFSQDHVLMSTARNTAAGASAITGWKPPRDTGCGGNVSESEPHRFLAICTGSYFYTDGLLDSIFGYSRVELFDVNSRRALMRIDGPTDTDAALSPSGKIIAVVTSGGMLRLYRVD